MSFKRIEIMIEVEGDDYPAEELALYTRYRAEEWDLKHGGNNISSTWFGVKEFK